MAGVKCSIREHADASRATVSTYDSGDQRHRRGNRGRRGSVHVSYPIHGILGRDRRLRLQQSRRQRAERTGCCHTASRDGVAMPPTLSQLRAWDTEHLINAATFWTQTADQWEDSFAQIHNLAQTLGWEGHGGEALRTRTSSDLATATAKTDELRHAAQIARTGASDISAAQRRALYAVEDAENASFQVGEDLSVTDTRTSPTAAEQAGRQAQAQALAGDINQRAAQLLGLETDVSGQLIAAASDVSAINFSGTPGVPVTPLSGPRSGNPDDQIINGPKPNGPHVRLVDDVTGPGDPPNPTPGAQPAPQIGPFPVPPQVAASAPPGHRVPPTPRGVYSHPRTCPRPHRRPTSQASSPRQRQPLLVQHLRLARRRPNLLAAHTTGRRPSWSRQVA